MSGIFGGYNLDGRPANREMMSRMSEAIAHRGADGENIWAAGPVALGHRLHRTTPESLREAQPLQDETGQICLVLDGRVDNRAELQRDLQSRGRRLRGDTDAELILRAYECWDLDFPDRVIGDFALAIWDGRKRRIVCARDFLGARPFLYSFDGGTFRFASEIQALFEDPEVSTALNEGMVGEYLASRIVHTEETLYAKVLRLPPAHLLIVEPGGIRKQRYWSPDPKRTIRYRTDDDYGAHFRELFAEAVKCRLRSTTPVASDLSGGLDSSSVACMAQSLIRDGGVRTQGLEAYSLVFPGLPCDESPYMREVASKSGVTWIQVQSPIEDPDRGSYLRQAKRYRDFPDYPNAMRRNGIYDLARRHGIRVYLSGNGGDHWFTGNLVHYADLFSDLKVLEALRQARLDARVPGVLAPQFPLIRYGLLPLLPPFMVRAGRNLLGRKDTPGWIDPAFARRINLGDRLRWQAPESQKFSNRAQEALFRFATWGFQLFADELAERTAASFGIELRHPLNDRRLAEFGLALPEDLRWRRDQTKFVLRKGMQGLLPEKVRQRLDKGEYSSVFVQALLAQGGEKEFNFLDIHSRGWLSTKNICTMFADILRLYREHSQAYVSHVWPVWNTIGLNFWLCAEKQANLTC
jgi:asparagine synthase (glutamine-hydrolysing)